MLFDLSIALDRSPVIAKLYESYEDELMGLAEVFEGLDDNDADEPGYGRPFADLENF